MGQPYIELRHRAPENRLRLPFTVPAVGPGGSPMQAKDAQQPLARPGQSIRMCETLGQHVAEASMVEPLNQQHLIHTATVSALHGADGIEEHLESEDSAVKDLEDVEVKDLVDLNLNLDPEDGMNENINPNHEYIFVTTFINSLQN